MQTFIAGILQSKNAIDNEEIGGDNLGKVNWYRHTWGKVHRSEGSGSPRM